MNQIFNSVFICSLQSQDAHLCNTIISISLILKQITIILRFIKYSICWFRLLKYIVCQYIACSIASVSGVNQDSRYLGLIVHRLLYVFTLQFYVLCWRHLLTNYIDMLMKFSVFNIIYYRFAGCFPLLLHFFSVFRNTCGALL